MPTDPLTGSRYPASTAQPNVNQDIQNAVNDLADNTNPYFTTTAARDSAYAAWVAQGNAMRKGLHCTAADTDYVHNGSAWVEMDSTSTWTSFSPGWTATSTAPSIGNGTLTGRYRVQGKTIHISIVLTLGSTTNGGTGAWQFTNLPAGLAGREQVIVCKGFTASSLNWVGFGLVTATVATPYLPNSSTNCTLLPVQNATTGGASGTGIPQIAGAFTFGSGHNLVLTGTYEAA